MRELVKIISCYNFPRSINQIEKEYLAIGLEILRGISNPVPVKDEKGEVVDRVAIDYLASQIDSLIVIGQCQCGDPDCLTVQFQHYRVGQSSEILRTNLDDGRQLSLFVNVSRGLLSGLQIIPD